MAKRRKGSISDPAKRGRKQSSQAKRRGFYSEPREEQNPRTKRKGFYFVCPNHGRIPRDEIVFLCNTCDPKKIVREVLVEKGMYLCPQCLKPGENFQCFLCGSTKVEMRSYTQPKTS